MERPAGGALLLLVAAVLITTRVKLYRLNHRPVDVGTTQDEVLASLGLAATIDIGEFGISLHFDAVLGRSTDGWAQFKADLVAALRKAAAQIKAAQQQQQQHPARIIIGGAETSRVLVVIPKAKSPQPPDTELLAAMQGRQGSAGRRRWPPPRGRRERRGLAPSTPRNPPIRAHPAQAARRGRVRRGPPMSVRRAVDARVLCGG